MALKLNLIVAACENMGIGVKGELPWNLRSEMAYFSRMTKQVEIPGRTNAVVMGRKTWNSIPSKFRPLPNRLNFVLTRDPGEIPGAVTCHTWDQLLSVLAESYEKEVIDKVWVIGGSSIYQMAMDSPLCHRIYLTRILHHFDCDTFFPPIDTIKYSRVQDSQVSEIDQEENEIKYRYEVYEQKESPR